MRSVIKCDYKTTDNEAECPLTGLSQSTTDGEAPQDEERQIKTISDKYQSTSSDKNMANRILQQMRDSRRVTDFIGNQEVDVH